MHLRYKLTRAEYQHQGVHLYWSEPKYRARATSAQIALGAAFVGLFWLTFSSALAGCIAGVAMVLLYPRFWRRTMANAYGHHYDLIAPTSGETEVECNDSFLFVGRKHLRSEVDWEAFTRLEADEVGFYLTYGPLQTVFIPRRAFASEMEAQRFWDLAQSYWQHAKPGGLGRVVTEEATAAPATMAARTYPQVAAEAHENDRDSQRLGLRRR